MELRKYKSTDCTVLVDLFYHTVHTVNAQDYTKSQLNVWATGDVNITEWDQSFLEHNTLVAEENGVIVGFGDMDDYGYLDKLYVHKDYQGRGVASAILDELERQASHRGITEFTTHASITAKSFFNKHGYITLSENTVVRQGIKLTNFVMKKADKNESMASHG